MSYVEGSVDLSIGAKIAAGLQTIAGKLDEVTGSNRRLEAAVRQAGALLPAATVLGASDVFPSSGDLALDLGGPANGRVWDVRRVVAGGVTPATAALGSADVYVTAAGRLQVLAGAVSLVDWVDEASVLPLAGTWGAQELGVRYPEHLWVVIRSGTAAQVYAAGARVVDRIETPTTRTEVSV